MTAILCVLAFWILIGQDGGMGYILFAFGLLGILVPFVLVIINAVVLGPSIIHTLILSIVFGCGSLVCYILTYNILWFTNKRGTI